MKTVTNNFKEEIRKLGREIDFKIFLYANDKLITQDNNFIMTQDNLNLVVEQFNQEEIEYTINADEIYNVSVVNRGELLSTMMKEVDFEVSKELKVGDVISCKFGLKVGDSYEYVDYGKYMIYEKEFNEDTKTYSYVAYDRMLLTMREIPNPSNFENKNILSVIQEICTITNLEFNGTSETALTYPNLNKVINQGTFTDLVMTYRDMLDMICQALGLSMIVEDNELVLKDINEKERTLVGKNSLYLEDAMEGNVLSYSVDGASEQDTYSGKNLCGIPDQTFTHCGVTVTIKDGEITLNGTTTSTGTKHISPIKTTTLNGDYVTNYIYVSGSKSGSGTSGNFNIRNASGGTIISGTQLGLASSNAKAQFTVSSDTSIIFGIYIQTTGITFNNLKFKPQLVEGTTEDYNWEKYVGGIESPNSDYPQKVETIPSIINLYNPNYRTSNNIVHCKNGTATEENGEYTLTATGTDLYIWEVTSSGTSYSDTRGKLYEFAEDSYTVTITNSLFIKNYVTYYDENKVSLGYVNKFSNSFKFNKSDKTGAKYFSIRIGYGSAVSGTTYKFKVMLEKGTIAHEYIPYGYYTRVKITGKNIFDITNVTIGRFVDPNNFNIQSSNSAWSTSTNYIQVQNNSTITVSAKTPSGETGQVELTEFDENHQVIAVTVTQGVANPTITKTLNENTKYVWFGFRNDKNMTNIQAEQNTTSTSYEPYKEKEVLIDMSKEDLFTEYEDGYVNSSTGEDEAGVGTHRSLYISVKPNTTYTPSFNVNRVVEYTQDKQFVKNTFNVSNAIKLSATTYYVRLAFGNTVTTDTLDNVTFFESNNSTPYYELCKIGDNKDRLVIDSTGNCIINKKIGKVVLNGSETVYKGGTTLNQYFSAAVITNYIKPVNNDQNVLHFSSHFINKAPNQLSGGSVIGSAIRRDNSIGFAFGLDSEINTVALCKTWLSNNKPEFYYQMETPETITLPNTQIPLFEGINHITLIDDLETDTSVVYNSSDLVVEEIDETYLNDTNVSFGKKFGPINSVVLSRSEDYDTIYRRDDESIEKNGLCEYKIKDNPILLYNDREEYIDEIFNQLKGIEYYPNDYLSKGITFLDWLDFYNVKIGDNTYKCLMLNDEIKVEQGLEESVYSEIPEETVTDYKTSSKTDKEVSFIVDKQKGQISAKVNKGDVINEINLDETGASINAEKISLKGKEINLTSDDITINSTNFNVDENGNVTSNNLKATNGEFSGEINATSGTFNTNNADLTHSTISISTGTAYNGEIKTDILPAIIELSNYSTDSGGVVEPQVRLYDRLTGSTTTIGSGGCYSPEFVPTSLEKNKKNFELLDSGLRIIKNIDIYKYHLKGQNDEDKKHIGFVIGNDFKYSQEVTSNENNGADLYGFVSVCCKAIQEQQEQINSLKEEIKQLKEENK